MLIRLVPFAARQSQTSCFEQYISCPNRDAYLCHRRKAQAFLVLANGSGHGQRDQTTGFRSKRSTKERPRLNTLRSHKVSDTYTGLVHSEPLGCVPILPCHCRSVSILPDCAFADDLLKTCGQDSKRRTESWNESVKVAQPLHLFSTKHKSKKVTCEVIGARSRHNSRTMSDNASDAC